MGCAGQLCCMLANHQEQATWQIMQISMGLRKNAVSTIASQDPGHLQKYLRSHMLQQGAVCCHARQHTAEELSFPPVLELSRPSTDRVLPCVAVRISVRFCCVLQPAELEALLTRALKSALQSGSLCNGVVIDGLGCSYADTATAAASLMSGFGLEKKCE